MSYYSDDEEIDLRIRRGRVSPAYDHRPRPHYYARGDRHLEIASSSRYERSRSRDRRERPVTPQPIVINNRIENFQDDPDDFVDDRRYLEIARQERRRSVSRTRDPGYMSREDYELERTRKELERYKLAAQREEDEKMVRKEMELKRLRDEKRAEQEKKEKKEAEERAVKEWKAKEAEKKEKERKEKEAREKEYKERLEDDLRRSGMGDREIALVLKKDKDKQDGVPADRPTFTRMARRYLSIETLNYFRIDYQLDTDPDYVLIKRWVPEYEQDALWNHTREIRDRRQPVILAIEEKKHKHHDHRDDEFEIVRKHKRKVSPSPLVTFFAGGKRI